MGVIQTVFLIVMENHNWDDISGSSDAHYINNTLLSLGSHAENYTGPGVHPSEPNYLWLEAGDNFGILNDKDPGTNHQSTQDHLVTLLQNAGISWKSYQEDISGTDCPLVSSGNYAAKHNPMVFFDDVTNTNHANSAYCIDHVRPFSELATDLASGNVASYNFITPNLCNDMHNACGGTNIGNGDTWLSNVIPTIMASQAYQQGGVILITWDESEFSTSCFSLSCPIGMIALSPYARAGYASHVAMGHSSTLKSIQTIFGVTPYLRAAGGSSVNDLGDLFTQFP